MSTLRREVSWGEGLVVAAFKAPRGLAGAVAQVHHAIGDFIGTRNTFAKLLKVADPAKLEPRDRLRAWLLLAALGEEPSEWGIDDAVVPPSFDPAQLRIDLRARRDSNPQPSDWWLSLVNEDDLLADVLPFPERHPYEDASPAVVLPFPGRGAAS